MDNRGKIMEWKFKANVEPILFRDFWYDLTDRGILKTKEVAICQRYF